MTLQQVRRKNSLSTRHLPQPGDQKLIQQIQGDLPLSLTPFAVLAQKIGWPEKKVIQRIRFLKKMGIIRRFGAILRHQKAGYLGNALVVWRVPAELITRFSQLISDFPAVSHCYLRPTFPDWPYNLYTMIHGPTIKDCYILAEKISQEIGVKEYRVLPSAREFKKSSMHYIPEG
ncbi:MAG: Lrp/AsnC family transcriptional regulator [bacterium]